jgi:hypothetical protein
MTLFKVSATYQPPQTQVVEAEDWEQAIEIAKAHPNDWTKEQGPAYPFRWSYSAEPVSP